MTHHTGSDEGRAVADTLAAHRLYGEDGDDIYECGCGATSPPEVLEEDFGELLWHETHVASLLAARAAAPDALAKAWSEGHAAGRDYQGDGWNSDAHDPEDDNPYGNGATT